MKRTRKANTPAKKKKNRKRLPTASKGRGGKLYVPSSHPGRAFELSLIGLDEKQLGTAFGVHKSTIADWKNKYPEFRKAIRKGRIESVGKVVHSLYKRAVGYEYKDTHISNYKGFIQSTGVVKHMPPETSAAKYYLNNKTRDMDHVWSDTQKHEITGANGGPINLSNDPVKIDGLEEKEIIMLVNLGIKIQEQREAE